MSVLRRVVQVGAGAVFTYGGVQGFINSSEYLHTAIQENDNAKSREYSSNYFTNMGRLALDNGTMLLAGFDTALQAPILESSAQSREVMGTTAVADVVGLVIGYGSSAALIGTGIGLVGFGIFGKPSLDYSRKVVNSMDS